MVAGVRYVSMNKIILILFVCGLSIIGCSKPPPPLPPINSSSSSTPATKDIEARFEKLNELRARELISESEFKEQKDRLLADL
jgi:hypothetical protein